jgi:hypothetical protein
MAATSDLCMAAVRRSATCLALADLAVTVPLALAGAAAVATGRSCSTA